MRHLVLMGGHQSLALKLGDYCSLVLPQMGPGSVTDGSNHGLLILNNKKWESTGSECYI